MFTSLSMTCTWLSIRPGISVRPPQSTTPAFGALIGWSDTSLTVSPSIRSSKPFCSAPTSGSSRLKFRNRSCAIELSASRQLDNAARASTRDVELRAQRGSELAAVAPRLQQGAVVRILITAEKKRRRVVRQRAARDVTGDELAGRA